MLQRRLAAKTGVAVAAQRLDFGGRQLHPRGRLADYGVRAGSTIHLTVRLVGGGLPASFRPWLENNFRSSFTEVTDRIGALKCIGATTKSASASRG